MSPIERREVIRDDYNVKRYEVIRLGGDTFVFDYELGRFLEGEEKTELLKHWIEGVMDFKGEVVVEYEGEENT